MRQPPAPQQERKPGRSFDDPSKPLGEGLLSRSEQSDTQANEDFRSREAQADMHRNGVAERAKAISVLRKAEELIADRNLLPEQATPRGALELAAGRVGLTIEEYDALVKGDVELMALEGKVLEAARIALARS